MLACMATFSHKRGNVRCPDTDLGRGVRQIGVDVELTVTHRRRTSHESPSHEPEKSLSSNGLKARRAAGMHCRPRRWLSMEAVKCIDVCFDIDRSIKGENASRHHVARRRTRELDQDRTCEALPSCPAARAMGDMPGRRDRFTRFVDDRRICLSNSTRHACRRIVSRCRRSAASSRPCSAYEPGGRYRCGPPFIPEERHQPQAGSRTGSR